MSHCGFSARRDKKPHTEGKTPPASAAWSFNFFTTAGQNTAESLGTTDSEEIEAPRG